MKQYQVSRILLLYENIPANLLNVKKHYEKYAQLEI